MKNALALAALVLSTIALFVAARGRRLGASRPEPARPASEQREARLAERLAALELEVAELREELRASALQAPLPRETAEERSERLADLARRIVREELSKRTEDAGTRGAAGREGERPPRRGEPAEGSTRAEDDPVRSRQELERLISQAENPTRGEEPRLQALRRLRGEELDGEDARLAVVDAMLEVGLHSTDPTIRADVWRQLSGVRDAELRSALLYALRNDLDAQTREEAAESLDVFVPDAEVEQALQLAAEHDLNADVRRQAAASLKGPRR